MQDRVKDKYEYIPLILMMLFMAGAFIHQKLYALTAPFGTLLMFIGLSVILFLYTGQNREKVLKKDRVLLLCIVAVIITPVNLFILGSGKGAALIVFDLVLIFFLILRGFRVSGRIKRGMALAGSLLMLLWYPVVRWDYGFNMVGLAFLILLIFGEILLEYVKNDLGMEYLKYVQVLFFITSVLLAICYQARSAALSMAVFGAFYLLTPVIINKRAIYNACIIFFTLGSILFTLFYSFLGMTGWNGRLLYKDLLSGRELIWQELWREFLKKPVTGIGSSYVMKNFFMFEVHNGLFDILTVHGIAVFIAVVILLIMTLSSLFSRDLEFCPDKRLALTGIYTLLFASFFENGFITTPYSTVFFALLLICT
ncbi:MAG: hypothetical protein IJ857_07780 [Lachnospiraceae bacterium]|nr:hypothetical protein [Lachnospiraceae bacterium]